VLSKQKCTLDLDAATSAALQHLGSLTKLQRLRINAAKDWAAAGCPGLQELKALTRLDLRWSVDEFLACISQLTALQQLQVSAATPTALNKLQALTCLTQLRVWKLKPLPVVPPPLQLPQLQHLKLLGMSQSRPGSFLQSCTQLMVLVLRGFYFTGPSSLVASTRLERLELNYGDIAAAAPAGAAAAAVAAAAGGGQGGWQQVFRGPGQLQHLTSLRLTEVHPELQLSDLEDMVSCCSSLQVLHLDTLHDSFAAALARLTGLTSLHLDKANDGQWGTLAQLTGLRELVVDTASEVSAVGLRQLAALEQLTCLGFNGSFEPNEDSTVLLEHMSDGPWRYNHAIINKVGV